MSLPSNVHVSSHPCLQAKLSLLRSQSTPTRETRALVNELSTILGVEAFAKELKVKQSGTDKTHLGIDYEAQDIDNNVALVPILRSGLGMVDAIDGLLPHPVPVYHLGLFREKVTLQPVEYYNNLPYTRPPPSSPASLQEPHNTAASDLAILLDPIIATGATAHAAIEALREWGVQRVVMISILGTEKGVRHAIDAWPEGVELWVGAIDKECNERGMIVPGVGDIGDRLFVAIGK